MVYEKIDDTDTRASTAFSAVRISLRLYIISILNEYPSKHRTDRIFDIEVIRVLHFSFVNTFLFLNLSDRSMYV